MGELSGLLTKSADYWSGVEKRTTSLKTLRSELLSNSYKSLGSSLKSASASKSKPVELFRTNLHTMFKKYRKFLDPINEVSLLDCIDDCC